jgi:hypothetical protein
MHPVKQALVLQNCQALSGQVLLVLHDCHKCQPHWPALSLKSPELFLRCHSRCHYCSPVHTGDPTSSAVLVWSHTLPSAAAETLAALHARPLQ